jgi:hypothetical protein
MIILPRSYLLFLFATAMLGALAGCGPSTNQPPTIQLSVPGPPLVMTLHARTTVYALDLHDQSLADYCENLKKQANLFKRKGREFFEDGGTLPPAPVVDLELEIRNNTAAPIHFFVGGSSDRLLVDIIGPEVIHVAGPPQQQPPTNWKRLSSRVTLGAGESYFERISSLESVQPFCFFRAYWMCPGDYLIRVSRILPRSELESGGPMLICPPAPVKVVMGPAAFWNEK